MKLIFIFLEILTLQVVDILAIVEKMQFLKSERNTRIFNYYYYTQRIKKCEWKCTNNIAQCFFGYARISHDDVYRRVYLHLCLATQAFVGRETPKNIFVLVRLSHSHSLIDSSIMRKPFQLSDWLLLHSHSSSWPNYWHKAQAR